MILISRFLFLSLSRQNILGGAGDLVDVDVAIGGTDEEGLTVSGPGDRDGPGGVLAGGVGRHALVEGGALLVIKDGLVLKIPELDTGVGGGDEPVVLGGEAEGVDGGAGIEGVEMLAYLLFCW